MIRIAEMVASLERDPAEVEVVLGPGRRIVGFVTTLPRGESRPGRRPAVPGKPQARSTRATTSLSMPPAGPVGRGSGFPGPGQTHRPG